MDIRVDTNSGSTSEKVRKWKGINDGQLVVVVVIYIRDLADRSLGCFYDQQMQQHILAPAVQIPSPKPNLRLNRHPGNVVEVGLRAISTSFAQGTNADQIPTAGRIRSTEPIFVTASLLELEKC